MANVEKAFKGSSTIYIDVLITRLHFKSLKISYHTLKDKWSIRELISHDVNEEEQQNAERRNKQAFPTKALKTNENITDEPNELSATIVSKLRHKSRHEQEDCEGFRKWLP
uniref:Uncharacterized protein n=1 Tax=Oryza nivara TaxID=4536 RepID=A0A0E0I8W0_ORYNI